MVNNDLKDAYWRKNPLKKVSLRLSRGINKNCISY